MGVATPPVDDGLCRILRWKTREKPGAGQVSINTRRSSNTAVISTSPPSWRMMDLSTSSDSAISPCSIWGMADCDLPISSASLACVTPSALRSSASR